MPGSIFTQGVFTVQMCAVVKPPLEEGGPWPAGYRLQMCRMTCRTAPCSLLSVEEPGLSGGLRARVSRR
jgi:hypothetical protein